MHPIEIENADTAYACQPERLFLPRRTVDQVFFTRSETFLSGIIPLELPRCVRSAKHKERKKERKKEDPRRNMKPDVPWIVGLVSLMVAWFVNPILAYYVPKILSAIGLGASKRLSDLETHIIPELKKTLRGVDQARMMERESKEKDDLATLNKMAARLRHALEDAEDISDDQQEIESYCNTFPQCLWSGLNIGWGWIAPIVWSGQAWLWRWVRKISFHLSEETASAAATCVVISMPVTQIVRSGFDSLLQWAQMISSAVATCVVICMPVTQIVRSGFDF